ncbi:uncharacterized protein NECHADRAFT_36593 [Fusarium vanettenii 77-13-4]|uniref:Zn(2)-C6 fungal-type domain-containing protein n=1 Tax=Fusarium vanettenii (strain ATCC MYA-4622 / CBS 123669 / FGSC 9596 / NRRL 45880 / 77-13-4) TaxID=660122 RepID=C7YMS9_FUSV7|nr:uncharacterized protein NECHADRAFT_36593 [Fusarium vanettenii 77-13-4]EEU47004.1 hypothetical protein NECHADRAFT_36593 [Fusarium vanettenii 77-13-4]
MPACHGCRVRKVKCDDGQPCSPCRQFDVQCVRSTGPRKRKNPQRGRLVAQIRGENPLPSSPTSSVSPSSTAVQPPTSGHDWAGNDSSPGSHSGPASEVYTPAFFTALLPEFEKVVYPFSPAVTPEDMVAAISMMHSSSEDAALVYAYGAVTTFLSQTADHTHGSVAAQINDLIYHGLEAHHRAGLGTHVTGRLDEFLPVSIKRIMTCIYLEIATMGLSRLDRSFNFIREAIAMVQTLEMHQRDMRDSSQLPYDPVRFQQVYWEAYIHERFLGISGYPCILPPLRTGLSTSDSCTPEHIRAGFNCLIDLFLILDETFLSYWQSQRGAIGGLTVQWIESKQVQLDQAEMNAATAEAKLSGSGQPGFTELQRADLFITRLWLRTLLWQLALSQGLLRSGPSDMTHEGLSLQFPASRLSIQLRNLVSRLNSIVSIATQGSGIMQKLFEIASTIADVLALPASSHDESEGGFKSHVKDFLYVVNFLLNLDGMRENQREYLREKYGMLQPLHERDEVGGGGVLPPVEEAGRLC